MGAISAQYQWQLGENITQNTYNEKLCFIIIKKNRSSQADAVSFWLFYFAVSSLEMGIFRFRTGNPRSAQSTTD